MRSHRPRRSSPSASSKSTPTVSCRRHLRSKRCRRETHLDANMSTVEHCQASAPHLRASDANTEGREENPRDCRVNPKGLMGLEPTTFCMAIVCDFRINASLRGFRLNPITGDYRGFGVYWSPNGPRRAVPGPPTARLITPFGTNRGDPLVFRSRLARAGRSGRDCRPLACRAAATRGP